MSWGYRPPPHLEIFQVLENLSLLLYGLGAATGSNWKGASGANWRGAERRAGSLTTSNSSGSLGQGLPSLLGMTRRYLGDRFFFNSYEAIK